MLLVMGASTAFAECPTAEWVCSYWPPIISLPEGTPTYWCEGLDCLEMNSASEDARLAAVDDEGPYPSTWVAFIPNEITRNLSCGALIPRGKTDRIVLPFPDMTHCAIQLETEDDQLYLWFFSSSPSCVGWVECQIY